MRVIDRFGALCGAASAVLVIVGGDVLGTPPGPQSVHPTGEQDLANLRWVADTTAAQVGTSLELLSFALLLVFVAYLCARVSRAGWLAAAALAGGILEIAIKLGSGAPLLTAYLLREEITPQTARVLTDMNGVAFVMTWIPAGVFVAFAAAAARSTGVVGRVLGWGGVLAGTATVLATSAAGVHVLSANFLPFLLCMLWTLLVSLRLGLRRSARGLAEVSGSAPEGIAVGV